jgi:cell division septal protein FtsQ
VSAYLGRALRAERPARRGGGRLRRIAVVFGFLTVAGAMAHVPWGELRQRWAVVGDVRVEGARYLDAAAVVSAAGLERGQDLLGLDLAAARRALLEEPRIAEAKVARRGLRGLVVRIEERVPVLLVPHGVPWEMDSAGVVMPPLAAGAVADVPVLRGAGAERLGPGQRLAGDGARRGIAWARALARRELAMSATVSELDVSEPGTTVLYLLDGTRVIGPADPPALAQLSALQVVLADLKRRQVTAEEVDLRFDDQVIVRPVAPGITSGPARSG